MSNTWAVVVAALGAALLSTGGAFALDGYRTRRQMKDEIADELKAACIQIISGAQRLLFKTAAAHISMEIRSGPREILDVLLRIRKPLDLFEFNDYLLVEQGKILDAQTTIWLSGDEELMKNASAVVETVGDLIVASTALPPDRVFDPSGDPLAKLHTAIQNLKPLTHSPEIEANVKECARNLARACVTFGHVMRERLETDDVDALLRTFLAAESESPPGEDSSKS